MKETVLRMSKGSVEVTVDGKVQPVRTVESVKSEYGDVVAYLLDRNGRVGIVDNVSDCIKRAIYVK